MSTVNGTTSTSASSFLDKYLNQKTEEPTKKNIANQDTFLTLLVTQLKHQDPLAPQEGAEFVAQLAQFNSLEQLININDRLNELVNKQNTTTNTNTNTNTTTAPGASTASVTS